MRRLLILMGIILVSVVGVNSLNKQEATQVISTPTASPVNNNQSIILDVEGVDMRISWVEVNPEKLELYSNLTAKQTSAAIREEKSCKTLVNGGFYSKENKHLGLIIRGNETISPVLKSSLFNGFLSIGSQAVIGAIPPTNSTRIALQSGPILMLESEPRTLNIRNDEQARRIAAATTNDDRLFFITITREGSEFQGPYLEELAEIIQLFSDSVNIKINSAINLDGGSASTFNTELTTLPERTLIGSYFCVK